MEELSPAAVQAVCEVAQEELFEEEDAIVTQGSKSSDVYIIARGHADVVVEIREMYSGPSLQGTSRLLANFVMDTHSPS